MITSDRIIVELAENRLDNAVELAREAAQRGCLLKVGVGTIFAHAIRFISSSSTQSAYDALYNAWQLKELCRGRWFFETDGLKDPQQIMDACERLEPKKLSVDYSLWDSFFTYWHTHRQDLPAFGSFDPRLSREGDGYNTRVALLMADKLLFKYGASGIICNTLEEGDAIRQKFGKGFIVMCRLDASMIRNENTVKDAIARGVDFFIVRGTMAGSRRDMELLAKEIRLGHYALRRPVA